MDEAETTLKVKSDNYGYEEEIAFAVTKELAEATGFANRTDAIYSTNSEAYELNTTGQDALVTFPTDKEVSGFTSTTTVNAEGNRIIISDRDGFSIDFLLSDEYVPEAVDTTNGNYEIEVTDIGSLTIQIGSNEHQTMDVRISEISAESLYIDTIDVTVKNGAEKALETLDDAIAKLSETRSRLGAFQNRLDSATVSLSATEENVTAAYSNLMDTDMAEEMAEYTQQNILDQAAVSVLAQANELPQQVLSLLQR